MKEISESERKEIKENLYVAFVRTGNILQQANNTINDVQLVRKRLKEIEKRIG